MPFLRLQLLSRHGEVSVMWVKREVFITVIAQKYTSTGCILLMSLLFSLFAFYLKSKKIRNDQELIQSDPISCPQNQKGKN